MFYLLHYSKFLSSFKLEQSLKQVWGIL